MFWRVSCCSLNLLCYCFTASISLMSLSCIFCYSSVPPSFSLCSSCAPIVLSSAAQCFSVLPLPLHWTAVRFPFRNSDVLFTIHKHSWGPGGTKPLNPCAFYAAVLFSSLPLWGCLCSPVQMLIWGIFCLVHSEGFSLGLWSCALLLNVPLVSLLFCSWRLKLLALILI